MSGRVGEIAAGRKCDTDQIAAGCKSGRARGYISDYRPYAKTRALLDQVQAVLDEYRQYWPLTCRQIFYRMVGAHGYDKSESAYGRLCNHLANARRARFIPFDAIRDDGVTTYRRDHFDDRDDFLRHVRSMGRRYTRNKLASQELHIEVWCEAAGMLPQIDDVSAPFSVRAYSSGGFDSLTAKKDLADRIVRIEKPAIILHLGDYDPSGVSIFDSVAQDVTAFVEADRPHGHVTVDFHRIALTRAQVAEYDLPTAPAKASTHSKNWNGGTCQLEALPPNIIADILKEALWQHIDPSQYLEDCEAEKADREQITQLLLPAS
ncbi:hypothetical protein [Roseovarius nitratireducens]|uniref:hypothetical protein n=1 Tax=Roseovarius nitratireducens TaxID=2044597 RepID=UPI001F0C132E|nr:hypothetical protein [Roseovarius nitratireducens]